MSTIRHLPFALPLCLALVSPEIASGEAPAEPSFQPSEGAASEARITNPAVSPAEKSELIAGNTAFALDLYQRLRARDGNLFYSPFSLSEALAMSWAGTGGDTEAKMADALHFTLSQERLHPAFDALALDLARPRSSGSRLDLANALWAQEGSSFQPSFLATLAQSYGARVHLADFEEDTDQAVDLINEWVNESTHGKIPEIVNSSSVSKETRLVLTNAVYFDQAWKYRFKPESTRVDAFTRSDGARVQVPMMSQTRRLRHAASHGWAAIELPYDGDQLSMLAILPDAGTLGDFERSLTPDRLESILASLAPGRLSLSLPRFEIDTSLKLNAQLAQLGMGVAFSPEADFSGIDEQHPLALGAVVHVAHVSVDEAGTEAAAATAIGMQPTSLGPSIYLNHPFLFLIRDSGSGAILFVGRVEDPSAG